ncbi:hypothetical protein ACIP5Y_43305 [Nocardia sp. NPDC088792]|uniref:hypothetical protein n=1 Tax=Nocardia sp. NPDC088792 TaxID=3364332 RepID=UPI00381483DC
MIGDITFILVGAIAGVTLGWITSAMRPAGPHAGGRTVTEIRSRIERESSGRHRLLA